MTQDQGGWIGRTLRSPIGAKAVTAITGLMLTGFLIAHVSGNLLFFAGPEALNAYAEGLKKFPAVLWAARFGLLGAFTLHVGVAIWLTRSNRSARPQRYACENTAQATFASRYMIHTGLVMLAFVVFHLAHFTWRVTDHRIAELGPFEVHRMLVIGFQQPLVAGSYVLAMIAIGLHLSHGIASIFQTLGINHPRYNGVIRKMGPVLGIAIAALFASIPLSIYFRLAF